MFVPIHVNELQHQLDKLQHNEYLFLAADGNLISSFGKKVHIGFLDISGSKPAQDGPKSTSDV